MTLRPATREDLRQMMSWFPNQQSCITWGGPEFRFPFDEQSFIEDTRMESLPSYCGVSASGALLGFGQYYLRAGRCHLSRLAISPRERGKGWGARLIGALLEKGSSALGVAGCSLFVSTRNERAARLYRRLGFVSAPYPEPGLMPPDTLYLVAELGKLREPSSAGSPPPRP